MNMISCECDDGHGDYVWSPKCSIHRTPEATQRFKEKIMTPLLPENSSSPVTPDSSAQTGKILENETPVARKAGGAPRQNATRYFLDTEFIEAGRHSPVQLISIGIVSEDGREFYAESQEFDPKTLSPWLKENVLPHLGPVENRKPVALIAKEVRAFIGDTKPEFWGYYADYDWVVFCQMFGSMIDLPKGWPMYCRDIKQLCDSQGNPKLPENDGAEHNALSDAKWNETALQFLLSRMGGNSLAVGASSETSSPSAQTDEEIAREAGTTIVRYFIRQWVKWTSETACSEASRLILVAITKAKAVREEKEQTEQASGLKEPLADHAQAVLQKALKALRTMIASANPHPMEHGAMYEAWREARAVVGDIQELLSEKPNVTGAPPISPSPSSLPPQSQGSEQGLLPCPFCGSANIGIWQTGVLFPNMKKGFAVNCHDCTSCGRWDVSEVVACDSWNKRAAPSVGRGPDEHLATPGNKLVENIWKLISDYENPEPETAAFVPRENFANTLRTLLMSAGLPSWDESAPSSKEVPVGAEDGTRNELRADILFGPAPSPLQTQGQWTWKEIHPGMFSIYNERGEWERVVPSKQLAESTVANRNSVNASLKDDKDSAKFELLKAAFGSCTCDTKTPDIAYHDELCKYRILESARIILSEPPVPAASEVEEKKEKLE